MKTRNLLAVIGSLLLASMAVVSCNSQMSDIGGSLAQGEVTIVKDSTFAIEGMSVPIPQFDTRSTTNLIGRLNVPEYGNLKCSFVAQMIASTSLGIPDSLGVERVDSMKLMLRIPRGALTGDSLAPQQVSVYQLTKLLPSNITNNFNPEGYYDSNNPLGKRNYTLSALAMNDSIYRESQYIDVPVEMPLSLARKIVSDYRKDPSVFQWPSTSLGYFQGVYVEPSFGSGCVANITSAKMVTYYNYKTIRTVMENEQAVKRQVVVKDSVVLFATAPEVLSSNNISFTPAPYIQEMIDNGEPLIVAPGGYNVRIKLPMREVIEKLNNDQFTMAVINNLVLSIAATNVKNDYGIGIPPYLLLVKTSELEEFFAQNKKPDNLTSFWGAYASEIGMYNFTSMRDYIMDLLIDGYDEDDLDYTMVPVYIETSIGKDKKQYITECSPYVYRPVMCKLDLKNSHLVFTYSKQQID